VRARIVTAQYGLPTEVDVSAPAVDDLLHRRLVATSAALQGARAAFVHSPNADSQKALATAKRRMDQLLDQFNDLRTETT
jgi:hypothetical protein